MKVTYYGHACFSVELGKQVVLFDPFITGNDLAKEIDINAIRADYILLTHGHGDHIADVVAIAQRTDAVVIANYEVALWLSRQGLKKVHPMNVGGGCVLDVGYIKMVNAVHSSSLPDGTYGGNPGGFVVETPSGNFYNSGDTALTSDMKFIGESTRLNFAALCLGNNFTMGIDDAIKAADLIHCNQILGLHYDTFPVIQIDHAAAERDFKSAGKTLHLLPIGGSRDF